VLRVGGGSVRNVPGSHLREVLALVGVGTTISRQSTPASGIRPTLGNVSLPSARISRPPCLSWPKVIVPYLHFEGEY
jgi:hypothetical protein